MKNKKQINIFKNKEVERIPLVLFTKSEKSLIEYNELSENIGFLLNFKPDAITFNTNPLILLEVFIQKNDIQNKI